MLCEIRTFVEVDVAVPTQIPLAKPTVSPNEHTLTLVAVLDIDMSAAMQPVQSPSV